jgi:hypothetical protein
VEAAVAARASGKKMVVVGPQGVENSSKDMNPKRDNNIHFTSNRHASPSPERKISVEEHASSGEGGFSKPFQGPHTISITKSETGFGFNVRGQIGEGGPMKSINGEFLSSLFYFYLRDTGRGKISIETSPYSILPH